MKASLAETLDYIQIFYDKLIQMQSDYLIKAKLNGKWGYIDYKGNVFIKLVYDEIDQPWNGMIMVKKDGKSGYFNDKGKLVIPCKYDLANPFTEAGKAMIMLDGKNGVVSKDGSVKFFN